MTGDAAAARLPELRRGAHRFLRRGAALAWAMFSEDRQWEITMPPEVAALPAPQRWAVHARQEARRVAISRLYDIDPALSRAASGIAASIAGGPHQAAVAAAGDTRAVQTLAIQPPWPAGFLRWRLEPGIGCNAMGAPVIACHWQQTPAGCWLAWWADAAAMAAGWQAQARADGAFLDAGALLRDLGPLWYEQQALIRPRTTGTSHEAIPGQPGAPGGDTGPGTPAIVLAYTTFATWWLLTCQKPAVQVSLVPVPAREQAADKAAGLRPCRVIVTAAAGDR